MGRLPGALVQKMKSTDVFKTLEKPAAITFFILRGLNVALWA